MMDMSVFAQLRWNFVYQRPQHIMKRMAKDYRVFYFEEPDDIEKDEYRDYFDNTKTEESLDGAYHHYVSEEGVNVVVPLLKRADFHNKELLEEIMKNAYAELGIVEDIFWYYTPMALEYTSFLNPKITIYDCMDQLSAFKFAPSNLIDLEQELFKRADVVFTGGKSLYNAKKKSHEDVYCFPSSIDKDHFEKARETLKDPSDQESIGHPRVGYFGVVDERFDIELLRDISSLLPDWNFIIIGPVVKIDPETLPKAKNIYYLGMKQYDELPDYLSNWDAAMMPFALNESTEYISPTKTPEYLAAGKRVVSTAIYDVVHPYEDLGLVSIGRSSREFADHIKNSLSRDEKWQKNVDDYLKDISWDKTFNDMNKIIKDLAVIKNV